MLLKPGSESHSYEPTPQDIKDVAAADMFVYVGGDSDAWISSIMDSVVEASSALLLSWTAFPWFPKRPSKV